MSEKATKPVFLTAEGQAKRQGELDHLRDVRRREIAERIHTAMEFAGDPMDNSEYQDAKNEQAFVEGRILELERLLSNAQLIHPEDTQSDVVGMGSTVSVVDQEGTEEAFSMVGSAEANPLRGRISNESPAGKALLGHRVGETVEVQAPGGLVRYTILSCENRSLR